MEKDYQTAQLHKEDAMDRSRDGTGSPGHQVSNFSWVGSGHGSRVSVSDPVFDPVLSFSMHIYCGIVSTE